LNSNKIKESLCNTPMRICKFTSEYLMSKLINLSFRLKFFLVGKLKEKLVLNFQSLLINRQFFYKFKLKIICQPSLFWWILSKCYLHSQKKLQSINAQYFFLISTNNNLWETLYFIFKVFDRAKNVESIIAQKKTDKTWNFLVPIAYRI